MTVSKPEVSVHALDQLDRDGGRTGDGQPQARQVGRGRVRMVEKGLVERGRARDHRDAVLGHVGDRLRDVEDGLRVDRRPRDQAGEDPRSIAEGVEERVDDEVAVATTQADQGGPVGEAPQVGCMGRKSTLGAAGRARGEEDVADVVGVEVCDPLVDDTWINVIACCDERPAVERPGGRVAPEHQRVAQVR